MMKSGLILVMTLTLFLICAPGIEAAYQTGDTVANFSLTDTEGNTFVLDDYQGFGIIITFWTDT